MSEPVQQAYGGGMLNAMRSRAPMGFAAMLAVGALLVGAATPASADTRANQCLSINGVMVRQSGTAYCETTASLTATPNVAEASGDNTVAQATEGSGDSARAVGDNSSALVDSG